MLGRDEFAERIRLGFWAEVRPADWPVDLDMEDWRRADVIVRATNGEFADEFAAYLARTFGRQPEAG